MSDSLQVEHIVAQIGGLPRSPTSRRDAVTVHAKRLHLARALDGTIEFFIEGTRESFGRAATGRALECGEFQEVRDGRRFSALLIRASGEAARARLLAHLVYEANRALQEEPELSNEDLLAVISPFLSLVTERQLLATEQQLGLLGELMFLTELLNRADEMGAPGGAAVRAWVGWDSASRDFASPSVAVEAKVTTSAERIHWVRPMYQLLPGGDHEERVYVYSVGVRIDRSRPYGLLTAVDRVLGRLDGEARKAFVSGLEQYAGVGFYLGHRRQYELEPGFLVTNPPVLIRVDHLTDILRPEAFSDSKVPSRVSDLSYRVDLSGLSVTSAQERAEVLGLLLGAAVEQGRPSL